MRSVTNYDLRLATKVLSLVVMFLFFSIVEKSTLMAQNFEKLRNDMVENQLKQRDIKSKAVLEAMRAVPRHLFVPPALQSYAYVDNPLPIGLEQTISQPYIVAFMTEQLRPVRGMKILEIGTGSGYQAAILAHIGCEVYTIELLEELAGNAAKVLAELHFNNVKVKCGNGYLGWPDKAPFDAIIVTAAPDKIPEALIEQLKEGGRMILPVGPVYATQSLKLITKKGKRIIEEDLLPVIFVPMVE
jgi:protein-L-isoaspartate(D-aspartate) O-methyltransferase